MKKIALIALLTGLVVLTARAVEPQSESGAISGAVVIEGTANPIADVKISAASFTATNLSPYAASVILDAAAKGFEIPADILQAAKNPQRPAADRGGEPQGIEARTNDGGQFSLRDLPRGVTIVAAERVGYFAVGDALGDTVAQAIVVVRGGRTETLQIPMARGAVLTGRVSDSRGKALPFSAVYLLNQNVTSFSGDGTLRIAARQIADDRGEYRISPIQPGEYYVAATPPNNQDPFPDSHEMPIPTLFPNVEGVREAKVLDLLSGTEGRADIQLQSSPVVTLSGSVLGMISANASNGTGVDSRSGMANLTLVNKENMLPAEFTFRNGMTTDAGNNTFRIPNVPQGTYDLYAIFPSKGGWSNSGPPSPEKNSWIIGRATVSVASADVGNISIPLSDGPVLAGRVTVDGAPTDANVGISLVPTESAAKTAGVLNAVFRQIGSFKPSITQDGSFTIPSIPSAHYRLAVTFSTTASGRGASTTQKALPEDAYIADIRQGSHSVLGPGIEVGSDAIEPIEVVIRTDGGGIDGTLRQDDTKPAGRKSIVLVPAEDLRQNPDLFKVTQSEADGHFAFHALAPGRYTVFAWESSGPITTGNVRRPEFIKQYEVFGTNVVISSGTRIRVDPKLIAR